jgi:hypothetical protein
MDESFFMQNEFKIDKSHGSEICVPLVIVCEEEEKKFYNEREDDFQDQD